MGARKAAKAFSKNPDAFLASKEASFKIVLSEQEKALLLAFTDDEIINAVKDNDLASFLSIAREKDYIGLISDTNGSQDIRGMFKTDQDYKQFMQYITGDPDGEIVVQSIVATFFLYAVAVAVQYGGVATIAAVEIGAVYGVGVYWDYGAESSSARITTNNREAVLRIWTDSNGLISDTSLYDEMINKQVKKISDIIIQEYPNADKDFVDNILRINFEGYYGLRK